MRRRRIFGVAAIAALVVLGTAGAIAFAGVSSAKHSSASHSASRVSHTTKTVSQYCVYVDRTDSGDSFGDLSALPKYGNKTCIQSKQGAKGAKGATGSQGPQGDTGSTGPQGLAGAPGKPGDTEMVTWNTTVDEPVSIAPTGVTHGVRPMSTKADPAGEVTLATIGPLTVIGFCGEEGEGDVFAETDMTTSQDGSFLQWDDEQFNGSFDNDGLYEVSQDAFSDDPSDPTWIGPSADDEPNTFAAQSADGTTSITGFPNEGVYVEGSEGPTCSFSGYLVENVAPSS